MKSTALIKTEVCLSLSTLPIMLQGIPVFLEIVSNTSLGRAEASDI